MQAQTTQDRGLVHPGDEQALLDALTPPVAGSMSDDLGLAIELFPEETLPREPQPATKAARPRTGSKAFAAAP